LVVNLSGHYFYNKVFIREYYYCIKFKTRQEVILALAKKGRFKHLPKG